MEEQDNVKAIEVFAGEFWQASMIKNLLENNNILAFLENEHMGTIAPWRVSAGGIDPVKVIISNLDYDAATQLIAEFNSAEASEDGDSEEGLEQQQ